MQRITLMNRFKAPQARISETVSDFKSVFTVIHHARHVTIFRIMTQFIAGVIITMELVVLRLFPPPSSNSSLRMKE